MEGLWKGSHFAMLQTYQKKQGSKALYRHISTSYTTLLYVSIN